MKLLFILNILLLVSGQTLWKMGLNSQKLPFSVESLLKCFFNPFIISGLLIYILATIIWLYLLAETELSLLYPLQSLCYVVAAFVALFLFEEQLPVTRWVGIFLITFGAYLVSLK